MSMTKTICLVLLYMACGATGDLMLGYGRNPHLHAAHPWMWVALGTTSLGIGYGIFLGLLKDVPLSVVVPAGAGSYIVIAALSRVVLHEPVSPERWIGTLLVSVGVSMVMLSDWQTRGAALKAPVAPSGEEVVAELPVPPLGVEVPVPEAAGSK